MSTEPETEPDTGPETGPRWWTITVRGPFIINREPPLPLACPWVVDAFRDEYRYHRERGDYDEHIQCPRCGAGEDLTVCGVRDEPPAFTCPDGHQWHYEPEREATNIMNNLIYLLTNNQLPERVTGHSLPI